MDAETKKAFKLVLDMLDCLDSYTDMEEDNETFFDLFDELKKML